jgi:flagellar biosynthesis protein FlhA
MAAGATGVMALMPGMPLLPFLALAGAAGAAAWYRREAERRAQAESLAAPPAAAPAEAPIAETLRMDLLRLELGYGLLSLAAGEAPRLTEQIRGLRRSTAQEMGFVLPAVRIQDNLQLPPDTYVIRVKEIEAGRGQLRPPPHLAIDPSGGVPDMPGERCTEPSFGLPALWIEERRREEALACGCTVVDAASVLATHLTELVRENMAELLSFAETQKLLDELPREQQKLVADLIPAQTSVGCVQRVLCALLAAILEGIQEACAAGARAMPAILATVRLRLARQISDAARGPQGYVPMIALSPEWEQAFAEALIGPPEERQLAIAPSKLGEFMQRLREVFDAAAAAGETPVLVCSGAVRGHVRAVVERFCPATAVLAQGEIHPRARIRTVGSL